MAPIVQATVQGYIHTGQNGANTAEQGRSKRRTELVRFKLHNRGLTFGVLLTTLGITGNANDLTSAHAIIAAALREGRRLIVITTAEIGALTDTEQTRWSEGL